MPPVPAGPQCSGRRADSPTFVAGRDDVCMTCQCHCPAVFPMDEVGNINQYLQDEDDGLIVEDGDQNGMSMLSIVGKFLVF